MPPLSNELDHDDHLENDTELENLLISDHDDEAQQQQQQQVVSPRNGSANNSGRRQDKRAMALWIIGLVIATALVMSKVLSVSSSAQHQGDNAVENVQVPPLVGTTVAPTRSPTRFPTEIEEDKDDEEEKDEEEDDGTTVDGPEGTIEDKGDDDDDDDDDTSSAAAVDIDDAVGTPAGYIHPNDAPFEAPRWIRDYVKFHKSKVLKDGKLIAGTRWIRWFCPGGKGGRHCGGLADRLKGMLQALLFGIVDNRVVVLEEWEKPPHPLSNYLEPNLINYTAKTIWHHNAHTVEGYKAKEPQPIFYTIHDHPCNFTEYGKNFTGIRYSGNFCTRHKIISKDNCTHALFKKGQVREQNAQVTLFWTLFRFSNPIHNLANQLRGPRIDASHYVAAHIRTGNGADWSDPLIHNTQKEWDKFSHCITVVQDALHEKCQGTRPQRPLAYLASDNDATKRYVQAQHPPGLIHAPEVEIMHIDKGHSAPNSIEHAYSIVVAEWKILMDSTCLIISDSGFSDLAWKLSRIQPRCAVSVDHCQDPELVQAAVKNVACPW